MIKQTYEEGAYYKVIRCQNATCPCRIYVRCRILENEGRIGRLLDNRLSFGKSLTFDDGREEIYFYGGNLKKASPLEVLAAADE